MPGLADWHAEILERSTADDPRSLMLRYNIGIYPVDVGVETVVQAIEAWRIMATNQPEPLRSVLLGYCKAWDYGLASKSAEGGRRLQVMQQEQMLEKMNQRIQTEDMQLDNQLNYTTQKPKDPWGK